MHVCGGSTAKLTQSYRAIPIPLKPVTDFHRLQPKPSTSALCCEGNSLNTRPGPYADAVTVPPLTSDFDPVGKRYNARFAHAPALARRCRVRVAEMQLQGEAREWDHDVYAVNVDFVQTLVVTLPGKETSQKLFRIPSLNIFPRETVDMYAPMMPKYFEQLEEVCQFRVAVVDVGGGGLHQMKPQRTAPNLAPLDDQTRTRWSVQLAAIFRGVYLGNRPGASVGAEKRKKDDYASVRQVVPCYGFGYGYYDSSATTLLSLSWSPFYGHGFGVLNAHGTYRQKSLTDIVMGILATEALVQETSAFPVDTHSVIGDMTPEVLQKGISETLVLETELEMELETEAGTEVEMEAVVVTSVARSILCLGLLFTFGASSHGGGWAKKVPHFFTKELGVDGATDLALKDVLDAGMVRVVGDGGLHAVPSDFTKGQSLPEEKKA
ncbi:hypothetical protein M427DRAFT_149677 [Gonapodya prolifera JEL478]|uniref:Uncharacterized protein n=1 Tax=Gonapodya prolifera (strain JEL478) TaxID=1344416 RepID=A0A138ZZ53_GONPJ|nr:hypothetical protein M427DRAFT_149677 [Gonapodya prolifera JEL478]|eukprot:KXS09555.1 hypothetical protein M427DRAFT_149677 [Gonapodya prolifera JEL478]